MLYREFQPRVAKVRQSCVYEVPRQWSLDRILRACFNKSSWKVWMNFTWNIPNAHFSMTSLIHFDSFIVLAEVPRLQWSRTTHMTMKWPSSPWQTLRFPCLLQRLLQIACLNYHFVRYVRIPCWATSANVTVNDVEWPTPPNGTMLQVFGISIFAWCRWLFSF